MTARHLVESCRSTSEGTKTPHLETRRNTAKILVGLTVVYLISYGPYHALWAYKICTGKVETYYAKITFVILYLNYKLLYLISTCFLLTNYCLNPVALFCTSSPFRQHLKRYLTCFCKTNSPLTDLELARRNGVCNHCLYFLQLPYTKLHLINYSKDNEFCVAVRQCMLSV